MTQLNEVHGTKFRPAPDYENIQRVIAQELGGMNFVIRGASITGQSADTETKLAKADAIVAQKAARGLLANIAAQHTQDPDAAYTGAPNVAAPEKSGGRGK